MALGIGKVRLVWLILLSLIVVTATGSWAANSGAADMAFAQDAHTSIPYQGRLTGRDGRPVPDGIYDFNFELYESEQAGEHLWIEAQRGIPVQDGYFSVLLGSSEPLAASSAARPLYVAVAVRGPQDRAFVMLEPRQKLVSPQASLQEPTCSTAADHNHCEESWTCNNVALTLHSTNDRALSATTDNSPAILADGRRTGEGVGVLAKGTLYGVQGETTTTNIATAAGVYGETDSPAQFVYGVYGLASSTSGENRGVYGRTDSSTTGAIGVKGIATSTTGDVKGVVGQSASTDAGVASVGLSTGGRHAGWFETGNSVSLQTVNNSSTASSLVALNNGSGPAGEFWGNVAVYGNLSKSGGGFKIDHPLDPENSYLNHSFVEAPDRMNVYNGNVILDADGTAEVKLPEYFDALNAEFRYQLTAIGAPAPNLYVAEEISGNRFTIAGGPAGVKVSWQVTGIRVDPWAKANPLEVEETKLAEERGFLLHPELSGRSDEQSIQWLHVPREMLMLTEDGELAYPLD